MSGSANRLVWMIEGALVATMIFVASAQATVYCVNESACLGTREEPNATGLKAALAAAESHANTGDTPDEVIIGPGTYALPGDSEDFAYTNDEAVIVRGAGAGRTILTRPAVGASGVLLLSSGASTIEGLTVVVPEHEGLLGVTLDGGTLEDDTIEAPAGAIDATGLNLDAGTFAHGTIAVNTGTAVEQRGGEVLYSTIAAKDGFGVQASTAATLRADVISGAIPLVSYYAFPLIVEDSLINMGGADTVGGEIVANVNGETEAVLRQDAIVGGGKAGLVLRGEGKVAAALLEDSIISEAAVPIEVLAKGKGAETTLLSEYSSFESAKDVKTEAEEGQVSLSDVNPVSTLPSFVSPLTGDFHLAPGSPLIDAGTPGPLGGEEFKTDLPGNPRVVHGRRDVGPYEYQWRPPVATAAVTSTTALEGEVLTFSGSAVAPEPGDSVGNYQWTFDDGSAVKAGAAATHAFSTLGEHTATLTATDAQGVAGSTSVTVDVVSAACSAAGCGAKCSCEATSPQILHLAISPRSLHAARKGSSVGKGHTGVRVAYTLGDRAGAVKFTVVRRALGVKVGGRCLARAKGRHGRGCTRRVKVTGSFTQAGKLGVNAFRFTGRIDGRALSPGRYWLVGTTGKDSVEAPFTVLG